MAAGLATSFSNSSSFSSTFTPTPLKTPPFKFSLRLPISFSPKYPKAGGCALFACVASTSPADAERQNSLDFESEVSKKEKINLAACKLTGLRKVSLSCEASYAVISEENGTLGGIQETTSDSDLVLPYAFATTQEKDGPPPVSMGKSDQTARPPGLGPLVPATVAVFGVLTMGQILSMKGYTCWEIRNGNVIETVNSRNARGVSSTVDNCSATPRADCTLAQQASVAVDGNTPITSDLTQQPTARLGSGERPLRVVVVTQQQLLGAVGNNTLTPPACIEATISCRLNAWMLLGALIITKFLR